MPFTSTPSFARRGPTARKLRLVALAFAGTLAGALGFFSWQHLYPVTAAEGWSYSVLVDAVPSVSALVRDTQGVLYITQELKDERGSVFTLAADGSRKVVIDGLSKPDGLAALLDGVVVSQEAGDHPLLWLHGGKLEALFSGTNVEGVASDGRVLFVIEDRAGDGRLLRFDPQTREVSVLRDGLRAGEGVAVCPNGELFYAEKGKGSVKRWRAGGLDEMVVGGLNAPGFLMCDDEGLWITEDATHQARLLLLDSRGSLQVLLRHLRSAQTVLPLAPGHLLVAEQGRGRVLEVRRVRKPSS
ncbi:MAG: hypothetical protein KDI53_10320 [Candidatus Accumulibacter sp.]|nr:hypothetical protein [Accumulibacter sp.]